VFHLILLCFSLRLCIGKFYFVLKKIVECSEISLYSKKYFSVLKNIVVFSKRLLCFRREIELCFSPMGHRRLKRDFKRFKQGAEERNLVLKQSQNIFIISAYTDACTSSCKIVVALKRPLITIRTDPKPVNNLFIFLPLSQTTKNSRKRYCDRGQRQPRSQGFKEKALGTRLGQR